MPKNTHLLIEAAAQNPRDAAQQLLVARDGIAVIRRSFHPGPGQGMMRTQWREAQVTDVTEWVSSYLTIAVNAPDSLTPTRCIPVAGKADKRLATPASGDDRLTIDEVVRTLADWTGQPLPRVADVMQSMMPWAEPQPKPVPYAPNDPDLDLSVGEVIELARGLVSDGSNPEYDRALVELTTDLLGENNRLLVARAIGVRS